MLYRQGDILLKKITNIPEKAKKLKTLTVAEGEVTGHHHRFEKDVQLLEWEGVKYAQVFNPSPLIHEEHNPIIIEKGDYEIIQEREYDYIDEEMKKVID